MLNLGSGNYISYKINLCIKFLFVDVIVGSADRHIPLLEEVFQTFPNMPINIDIKVNDGNLIEKVRLANYTPPPFIFIFLNL